MNHRICICAALSLAMIRTFVIHASAKVPSPPPAGGREGAGKADEIRRLPVEFGETASDVSHAFPGFFDRRNNVFYQWREVAILAGAMPRVNVLNAPSGVDLDDKRTKVLPVDPPVEYVDLGGGRAAPGWYDHTAGLFFRWRGVEVSVTSIPPPDRARIHDPKEHITVILVERPRTSDGT